MSIISNKSKGGNSSSFAGMHQILKGLQATADNTNGLYGALISILNATVAHQDMEILLVRDTGNGDLVVQQIREYDETTQTWTTSYTDVSGAPYVPVGPLEYLDASAVLNLILVELEAQGVTLDGIFVDTTSIAGEDFATELTLDSVDTSLTPQTRQHFVTSEIAVGNIIPGSLCGSVFNAGSAAGIWEGVTIEPGITIPWLPIGNRDTYGIFNFNATGTEFIIEYTT